MMVGFEIVDTRPIKGFGGRGGSYQVRFSAGGSVTLFQKTYTEPGQYLEEVPCPAKRQYSTIFVEMKNELGQHFEDQVRQTLGFARPLLPRQSVRGSDVGDCCLRRCCGRWR